MILRLLEMNLTNGKIQINMNVNFVSSKDTGETRTIFAWSDNEEIRSGNETDDIINELFKSFLNNYQKEDIEKLFCIRKCWFIVLSCWWNKFKRGKSYIKSPEWLVNKRATINPKSKDNKYFKYSTTVALNQQNIENHPERISNIESLLVESSFKNNYKYYESRGDKDKNYQ